MSNSSFSGLNLNIFEQLFKDNYEELYYRTYRYVGNKEETETLVQDAFVELWEKHRDHEAEGEVKAYIYELVHRRATEYLKSQMGEEARDIPPDEPAEPSDEPEEEEEQEEMENWLEKRDANREEFEKIKRIWEGSEKVLESEAPDVDEAWESVRKRVAKPRRRLYRALRIAAGILFLVLGYWAWQELRPAPTVVVSVTNKRALDAILLPDGSKVWLNLYSSVSYPESFGEEERRIRLEGEAVVEVVAREKRPFILEAEGLELKVPSASFGLMAYPDSNRAWVQVQQGEVAFLTGEQRMDLKKGEGAILNKQSGQLAPLLKPHPNWLGWHTRRLSFEETRLQEAIPILEETYEMDIELASEQLARCRFSATFEGEPLEKVLESLKATLGLEIERKGRSIQLMGEGCPSQ